MPLSKELQDKVAVITGGSRGIGRAVVLALCSAGADCAFTFSRDRQAADSLVSDVAALGRTALPVQVDVKDFDGARSLVEQTRGHFGRYDMLVNNAGITRDRSVMMMSREEWTDVIDTNLTGVFNVTRASIITFLKQRSGGIVSIASVSGIRPLPGQANYAAAKAGVIGFTKSLAQEVALYNVRVNAVAPGFIETTMVDEIGQKMRDRYLQKVPLGRFGKPEEVGQAVLFLLSDRSRYITGQTLQLDGGLGI